MTTTRAVFAQAIQNRIQFVQIRRHAPTFTPGATSSMWRRSGCASRAGYGRQPGRHLEVQNHDRNNDGEDARR
jgi:hypothetical protein